MDRQPPPWMSALRRPRATGGRSRYEPVTEPAVEPGMEPGTAPATWAEIVEQHSARVFRLALRLTGDRHDAEDLTQEGFVRVFRSLDTYRTEERRAANE